jgi:predicted transcriptional regulator of viral defense system
MRMTLREDLWEVAVDQYGYVTTRDVEALGVDRVELAKLGHRGVLDRVSQGVYRFPAWPVGVNDHLMEAVLWPRDEKAALSHETALYVYDLSDINPDKVHVTIPERRNPLRRKDSPASLGVHYETIEPKQIGWWESIPIVTVATAIDQCIAGGTRRDIVMVAIENAQAAGRIDEAAATRQRAAATGAA